VTESDLPEGDQAAPLSVCGAAGHSRRVAHHGERRPWQGRRLFDGKEGPAQRRSVRARTTRRLPSQEARAGTGAFSPEYGGAAFLGHARAPTESAIGGTRIEYSTRKKALPSAWANRGATRALLAKVPSGPWSCLDLLAL
jgi:hypothetical protein